MSERAPQQTRVAAYAVAVRAGRILLTRLAPGERHGGWWTLPGGGLDFGEMPEDALGREVFEETGLRGPVTGFLGVDSRVYGPHPADGNSRLHAIRLLYTMDLRGEPRVVETGGSTVDVRWQPLSAVRGLTVVDLVETGLVRAGLE